jgi:hypothetical protein
MITNTEDKQFYKNDFCEIKRNHGYYHLRKNNKKCGNFCWFGIKFCMDSGQYKLSFNIKSNKKFQRKFECGYKIHNPDILYNLFLDDLKVDEIIHCEINIPFIKKNDLCIFIFDSYEYEYEYENENENENENLIVEISDICYTKINEIENINYPQLNINCDICISINVHEKPDFLIKQLENIENFVKCDYCVILNCNKFMFDETKNINKKNIFVNPYSLEKMRFHGSLLHGICKNMEFSLLSNIKYKYFIVLSSRNLFYNELNIEELEAKQTLGCYEPNPIFNLNINPRIWHWPCFSKSKLYNYCISNNFFLYDSAHEGLCLYYETCKDITNFLNNNIEIKNDLFNFNGCCEEFALQTLSTMNSVITTNKKGFKYIGHGTYTQNIIPTDKNLFVYKTIRV